MNTIKKIGKRLLCVLLEAQARRLRKKHSFTIVAVVGSVGKTSTKLAIAKCLATKQRVQFQEGNYNDRLTVPLVLFGHVQPGLFNFPAWIRILMSNELRIHRPYPYDVAVLELGTDGPGQLKDFGYLKPELMVVSAIAAEHMEYFGSVEAVAKEELSLIETAKLLLINHDDVEKQYLPESEHLSYGQDSSCTYRLVEHHLNGLSGQTIGIEGPGGARVRIESHVLGMQGAKAVLAAGAAALALGWEADDVANGLKAIQPVSGRMRLLEGTDGSKIIDDTYNASPIAVEAALDVLMDINAGQRIAVLGSMNELGSLSAEAHKQVGQLCDPTKLNLVVTIGNDAESYLAPAARENGCDVASFKSPVDAGLFVKSRIGSGTVVMAKGSQNGVFAEEAVKQILANPNDSSKLVRQSAYWLAKKRAQFPEI